MESAPGSSRKGLTVEGLSLHQKLSQTRPELADRLAIALSVTREAATLTKALQKRVVDGGLEARKDDASIVTVGDFAVQALILQKLAQHFPDDGFLAEETSDMLRKEAHLAREVLELVSSASGGAFLDEEALFGAIDLASKPSSNGFRWVLDPIDGTRGFKEGLHFCLGLGLLERGRPSLGFLACPNDDEATGRGRLFIAAKEYGSFALTPLTLGDPDATAGNLEEKRLSVRKGNPESQDYSSTLLLEGPFTMHALNRRVQSKLGSTKAPLRIDSMAKYGRLSAGEADLVLRLHTPGYREHIWDHLAGVIVLEEAGGVVTDQDGHPLDFSVDRDLPSSVKAIISSRGGSLHEAALRAVREVLQQENLM